MRNQGSDLDVLTGKGVQIYRFVLYIEGTFSKKRKTLVFAALFFSENVVEFQTWAFFKHPKWYSELSGLPFYTRSLVSVWFFLRGWFLRNSNNMLFHKMFSFAKGLFSFWQLPFFCIACEATVISVSVYILIGYNCELLI